MRLAICLACAVGLVLPTNSALAAGGQVGGEVPPIYATGARVVDLRNTSGYLARYTTIPTTSLFSTTGNRGSCTFTADTNGTTYDGQRYTVGQTVHSSRWIFVEGEILSYGDYYSFSPVVSRGPLRNAFRTFLVYCDSQAHFTSYLLVYASDSMINPRTRITSRYNGLQLEAPLVWRNPVMDKWGGLITRYPSWLAIGSPAWRSQTSNVQSWRGWRLYLHLVPVSLDFHVVFTPDPAEPSTPFDGFVSCIPRNGSATAAAGVLPAFPQLPDLATPGVNGPCMWTPPGPGSVAITARITYRVQFWASGYTEQLADYVWSGPTAVFPTGELSSVNING